ncbi:MAG: glutaredoxin family protein [Bacillota bacterium]
MLKDFLRDNQVDYQLKKVDEDKEAMKYMRDVLKSRSVPTVVIGDKVIIGFEDHEEEIKEALGIR